MCRQLELDIKFMFEYEDNNKFKMKRHLPCYIVIIFRNYEFVQSILCKTFIHNNKAHT